MARQLRIQYAGALYHVFARGNNREDLFLTDEDRRDFIGNLGRTCAGYDWRIWAWCLMTNHYHLLVETKSPTLSAGMREVNGVYAQRFNRRHDRVGHVLQGRYKAILVDKESYLSSLLRYIVLNPVRAGLVRNAIDWRWSSYRAVVGRTSSPEWLATDETLKLFDPRRKTARAEYASWVADGIAAPDPTLDLPRTGFIGDDAFIERILAHVDPGSICSENPKESRPALTLDAIAASALDRDEAIRRAYATEAYSMADIARHFGVHRSTVHRVLQRQGVTS